MAVVHASRGEEDMLRGIRMRASYLGRSLPLCLLCAVIAALTLMMPGCDAPTSSGVLSQIAAQNPELAEMVRSAKLRPATREGRGARLATVTGAARAEGAG